MLVDQVLPRQPIRQWVLSLPFALRYLLATRPEVVTQVLDGVYRREGGGQLRFVPVLAPTEAELKRLVQRIAERIGRSHIENALSVCACRCRRVTLAREGAHA